MDKDTSMKKGRCKECGKVMEYPEGKKEWYCSIECACYAGVMSVRGKEVPMNKCKGCKNNSKCVKANKPNIFRRLIEYVKEWLQI